MWVRLGFRIEGLGFRVFTEVRVEGLGCLGCLRFGFVGLGCLGCIGLRVEGLRCLGCWGYSFNPKPQVTRNKETLTPKARAHGDTTVDTARALTR